jgi:uncharacterized membrane protein
MKDDELSILILVLIINGIVIGVLILMPILRREKAFFGVRVSRDTYEGEGRRILRRYWLCLIASFVALEAIGLLTAYYRRSAIYAVMTYVVTVPVVLALYAAFSREVRPFRLVGDSTKFATSLRTRRLKDYTTLLLEALIVVLAVTPFVILVHYYPALPERIPVHWGLGGTPDRWATKSLSTVFLLPVLAVYLQSWLLLLKHDLVHAKMTVPAAHAELYFDAKEQLIKATTRMLDWLRSLVAILLGGVSMFVLFSTIESLRHWMSLANLLIWPIAGMLPVVAFYYLYRFLSINNTLEKATGNSNVRRESEAEKWSSGGLFYYNPDDPALIVEKRDGLGYTYNFAGNGIRIRMAFLAVLPVILFWALLGL